MSGSATNVIQAPKMEPRIMRYELSVAMERGLLQRGAMPRFSLNDDGIVVRAQQKLLKRINVIWVVQSLLQKYFASPVGQIISTNSRHPTPQEGRIMIVTNAGWVAVDAAAFCVRRDCRASRKTLERSPARGRETIAAYGKIVWS
jgi:hypothetical protein